jgi:hypothetical protein
MKDVGKVYGGLVYFTAISYSLRPLGIFCDHLVYFSSFGMLHEEKSGNPAANCPARQHSMNLNSFPLRKMRHFRTKMLTPFK